MAKPKTPTGVVSFPSLFTPRLANKDKPDEEKQYSVVLIFDQEAQASDDYKTMKRAVLKAAKEKFGENALDMIKKGKLTMPFRDGEDMAEYDGFDASKKFVRLKCGENRPPDVVSGTLAKLTAKDVYSGCMGRASYDVYAYDKKGNKGVAIGLINLQVTDLSTPRIDNRVSGKDDFEVTSMKHADMSDDDDVSDDMFSMGGSDDNEDDEIPF